MFDPNSFRKDFPMLRSGKMMQGKPLVWLDNASTTFKPDSVVAAITRYYTSETSNSHRGDYDLCYDMDMEVLNARKAVADFIGAETMEIVFTSGTTGSINLLAYGYGAKYLKKGDEILITEAEHASNVLPWYRVEEMTGCKVNFIPLTKEGRLTAENLEKAITPNTKLVCVAHVTNVLGFIAPIKELARIAHKHGALICVDGAQSVPHLKTDVKNLDVDFLSFSGHKLCGPTGIGVLYGKMAWLNRLCPSQFGGEMIDQVTQQTATFKPIPWRFEAGTPNISGAIALGAAIDYLSQFGMRAIAEHEQELAAYAIPKLLAIDGLTLYGPQDRHTGVLAFNLAGIHPHDAATALDLEGVAIRAGHHCAQPLMDYLGVNATLRASFYLYNDQKDVDRLIDAIKATKEFFENGFEQA